MFKLNEIKINYMKEPITIEENPKITWNYTSSSIEEQKTFRLYVKDENNNLIFDSTPISSSKMSYTLEGIKLPSRGFYNVELITTSTLGSEDSLSTHFETTLRDDEWKGRWTSMPSAFNGGTIYFRKNFTLAGKKVKKARVYVCGIGYHELYLNGKKVGDKVLNPGVTNYDKTLLYDIYKVEEYLNPDQNVIGVEVGYGWYGQRKMLLQFYIDFVDGTSFELHSDCNDGWRVSSTPRIMNSIYDGEVYDARKEDDFNPSWCDVNFSPEWFNGWMYTILTQVPVGKLRPQEIPPIRVLNTFKAKKVIKIKENDSVIDFGQNMAGYCTIKVQGERGSKVTLLFGEGLTEEKRVNQLNLRSAKCRDVYILKGKGEEIYTPAFTYHGFQYVEVITEGKIEVLDIEAHHVHSDTTKVGEFSCSDEKLNYLHKIAVFTEQNNQTSILTDCPQRDERFGWLNDVSSRQYQTNYNFDMDRFYNKVVRDISETQNEKGCIADTAPYYTGGQPADTTTASYLLLAVSTYELYGDDKLAKREYKNLKAWVDYLLTRQKDFVMDYYYYADWVPPITLKNSNSDGIYVSSLFLNWHLQLMAKLAEIVGNEEDKEKYLALVKESKKSINEKYYHVDEKYFCNNTQTENAMAVSLNICKDEDKKDVVEHIVKDIIDNNYHLTCGNQGYRHVFYLLCEYGYADLAIKVLENEEYPGWGFMVKNGATTVWERWEAEMSNTMDSFDHPMFGSYDAIFYHDFGGIQYGGNGCDKTVIHPIIPESLTFVNCSFSTVKGLFKSCWKKENNQVIHDIDIPQNCESKVILDRNVISVNGKKETSQELVLKGGHYQIITE